MALTVDKNGRIIEKYLTLDEDRIRNSMSNAKKDKHKKVLIKALQVRFNRRTAYTFNTS